MASTTNDSLSQSSSDENLNELEAVKTNDNNKLMLLSNDEATQPSNACACGLATDDEFENPSFERENSGETVLPMDFENATASALPLDGQSGLQKLLNKQKMELAFELRRLQYANRPVSNTDSKTRLEQFFTENVTTPTNEPTRARRDPTQFRSEATRNEIDQLSSQARVSNVLQTARQRLESALQRMVTSTPAQTRVAIANLPIPTPPPQPTIAQSAAYTNGLHQSQQSIASNVSSNIVIQSSDGSTNVYAPVTAWVPVAQPQPATNNQQPAVVPTAPWLNNAAVTGVQDPIRVTIENLRREQIIEEISELVHQQLVTQTLESEFRSRLEERVMAHLQNSGTDGNRTRDYIRNINQTEHVERNDFSHLGIYTNNGAAAVADNLDSASTYHGSQQQQQHQQRNATASNTREIRALKSEIGELKSMMKLSFELQLDMQRALRQEISALIAGTFTSSSVASANNNNQNNRMRAQSAINSRASNDGSCIICTEGSVDTVLYKCGHMCTCYACSMTLKQTNRTCPVCRAPIDDILRTYRCNLE